MCSSKIKILTKANDNLISFCNCSEPAIATSGQADCPWCGCGWLFSCVKCRKAFTFAKVTESTRSYEEIAQEDFLNQFQENLPLDNESVLEQANWMKTELADIPMGTECVILDGSIIPISKTDIEFDGWFAHHKFETVPHVSAQNDKTVLSNLLSDIEYWTARELSE